MIKFNNGCDIHTVGNIRNSATMLVEALKSDHGICIYIADRIIRNIETKCVEFITQKFQHIHGQQKDKRFK